MRICVTKKTNLMPARIQLSANKTALAENALGAIFAHEQLTFAETINSA